MGMYSCEVPEGALIIVKDIDTKKRIYREKSHSSNFNISLPNGRYVLAIRGGGICANKEFSIGTDEEIADKIGIANMPLKGTMTRAGTRYSCSDDVCKFTTMDMESLIQHELVHKKRAVAAKQAEDAAVKAAEISASKAVAASTEPSSLTDALKGD